nr:MAG TPA: hypothetical protein [Caudoviricetes sp.]
MKEVKLQKYQTKLWIQKQKEKTKDENVIFILPNGKKI